MKKCGIISCRNNSVNEPKKTFFCSPMNPVRRAEWAAATGSIYTKAAKFYICEDHFDMVKDVEYYTLLHNRPRLVPGAVPSRKISANRAPSTSTAKLPSSTTTSAISVRVSFVSTSTQTTTVDYIDSETQTATVDSMSTSVTTPVTSPAKRKLVSSSSSNEPTSNDPSREFSTTTTTTTSQEASGSIYEPESGSETGGDDDSCSEGEDASDGDDSGTSEFELTVDEARTICDLTIKCMQNKIQHYTGIPKESEYVIDLIEKVTNVSRRNIFLVLRKIRHNETFTILADAFGMTRQNARRIFSTDIVKLAMHLKPFIYWPDAKEIKYHLPLQFKHKFKGIHVIMDCFETSIAKPSNPVDQALSYSSYKHSNTVKHLIGATPDGIIIYISKGFTGRISDNEIVKRSGFLEFVGDKCEILADRGFKDIDEMIAAKRGKLYKSPSTEAGKIYTTAEAKLCIHIERVINKLRAFNFLKPHHSLVRSKRSYIVEYSVIVASAICNMRELLIKI